MARVNFCMLMVTNMKGTIFRTKDKVMERLGFLMEKFTKVNILMTKDLEQVFIPYQMVKNSQILGKGIQKQVLETGFMNEIN